MLPRRAALAILVLVGWAMVPPMPANAQDEGRVTVRFTDADGRARIARLSGVQELGRACVPGSGQQAPIPSGARQIVVTLIRTGETGRAALVATDQGAKLLGLDGLLQLVGECEASPGLLSALERGRPVPSRSGAWTALLVVGGGFALMILLTALAGRGVGPAPELGPVADDEHHH